MQDVTRWDQCTLTRFLQLTGNDPARMAESAAINKSLSVLGQVVHALNTGAVSVLVFFIYFERLRVHLFEDTSLFFRISSSDISDSRHFYSTLILLLPVFSLCLSPLKFLTH
jgi:hypothetical protein